MAALIKVMLARPIGAGVTAYIFYTHQDLERAALLRAFDAAEADALRVLVVQAFDGVAVEAADDEWRRKGTGEERGQQLS